MAWTIVKEFRESGVGVSVSESDHRRPLYSFSVWKINDEAVYRFFPIKFEGKGKRKHAEGSPADVIARLVNEARDWCLARDQEREDIIIAELESKERAQLERDKPKQRGGTHR